jgi:copper chaperone
MAITLKVSGMKCGGCVNSVREALEAVPGVASAEVSLEEASAVITGNADVAALVQAVQEAGFSAISD